MTTPSPEVALTWLPSFKSKQPGGTVEVGRPSSAAEVDNNTPASVSAYKGVIQVVVNGPIPWTWTIRFRPGEAEVRHFPGH